MSYFLPSYYIITEGSKSATHSKQYVKMSFNDFVIFYLVENTSGAKGPLSARKPRIRDPGEPEIYAKNPSTPSWGSVENSGVLS